MALTTDDPLSTRAEPAPHQALTSPRHGVEVVARPAPLVHELTASGLTWVNVVAPDVETAQTLAERFGWHPLDVEDVVSKRQRPKVDDYEDDGYLFAVLHFPVYDKAVQRLNAAELDIFIGHDYLVTIPNRELLPVTRLFARCEEDERAPRAALREGLGPAALRGARRPLRLLLPDPRQDRRTSSTRSRTTCSRARSRRSSATSRTSSRRSSRTARSSSPSARRCACSSAASSASCPEELELYFDDIVDAAERIWDLLDNYKEVVEALESTNESVISHRQNDVLRVLTVFSVTILPLTLITGHLRHERRSSPARARTRRSG